MFIDTVFCYQPSHGGGITADLEDTLKAIGGFKAFEEETTGTYTYQSWCVPDSMVNILSAHQSADQEIHHYDIFFDEAWFVVDQGVWEHFYNPAPWAGVNNKGRAT